MPVNGIRKFSLIDWPGKVCCIVFFGNCNFRCPFCHNPALVFDPESQGRLTTADLEAFFSSRTGKLEGVVFSGGEPTLDPELETLARLAHKYGLMVRVDSNGSHPEVLKNLFEKGLLDSLGIDFKAPVKKYAQVCGNPDPAIPGKVCETLKFALQNKIPLEVRTTVHKTLLSEQDLHDLHKELVESGINNHILQQFHHAELIDEKLNDIPTYSDAELKKIAADTHAAVRGVF